jgi:hypothetical protein
MNQETQVRPVDVANNELARECLTLIGEIASRGARSCDPEQIGYALQELSQVLLERTGTEDTVFEPVPSDQIGGLSKLHEDLDFVNCGSQDLKASALPRKRTGPTLCRPSGGASESDLTLAPIPELPTSDDPTE